MKKFLLTLLALTMVIAMVACSKKDNTEDDDKSGDDKNREAILSMATEGTFPPYEYYENNKLVGIDVEVAQAIADKLDMELEITDINFEAIIPGIQSKKYDIGMAGMTASEKRKEQVNFSTSYSTGIQVIIVKEGSPITSVDDLLSENANHIVGTQSGTTGFLYATDDIEKAGLGTVKSFAKTTDAVEALKNGQVDCVILDNEPAKKLVSVNTGLKILDTEYTVEEYAIAVAKDNTELLNKINTALDELIQDGTVKKIVDKYITD